MKNIKLKILSLLTIILVFSCSPATSNLNGDIFLTMKNGSVKPVAASEVYLFPIETDFDSSFVTPLKAFINSAKYNIAKMEVEEACNEMNEELPSKINASSEQISEYYSNNLFSQDLDSACDLLSTNINTVKLEIQTSTENANQQSLPLQEQLDEKKAELAAIKSKIEKLASDQGIILKKEQIAKLELTTYYKNPNYVSSYSSPDYVTLEYKIFNGSDYIIKGIELGQYLWKGDPVSSSSKMHEFTFSSYSVGTATVSIPSDINQYSESLPGLTRKNSVTYNYDRFKAYTAWPNDRWLDENINEISVQNHEIVEEGYCRESRYLDCANWEVFTIDLPPRKISEVEFGMPYTTKTDANNKSKIYTTESVNWSKKGTETEVYKSSPLHDKLKSVQSEIKALESKIDTIKQNFSIQDKSKKVNALINQLANCSAAQDLRDTEKEVKQCLSLIDNQEGLVSLLNNSNSTFGKTILDIFDSISDQDLGYSNFEELLNAFAKSRNALEAVSSIQGAYSFSDVPLGQYVIFTSYEDRFNGVGHWFEEIDFQAETKLDLNNLNYKESGVYSYLRDKIDQ